MAFRDFFRDDRDREDEERRRWRAGSEDWREQQGRWGGRREWPPDRESAERRAESFGYLGYAGDRDWPEGLGRRRYEPESYEPGYGRWGREERASGWRDEEDEGRGPHSRYYARGGGMAGREAGRMWGEGGRGQDIEYGRRGALGYGGYGGGGRELSWRERGAEDYRGKGPRGYRRSDDRIREDVCDSLTEDPRIDASQMEVTVKDGEVTLSGQVRTRVEKRWAEDTVARIGGVSDVNNTLRVSRESETGESGVSASPEAKH